MITADTITDEQIRELLRTAKNKVTSEDLDEREWAYDAMFNAASALSRNLWQSDGSGTWVAWRARCAEILNARCASGVHFGIPDGECRYCGAPDLVQP